MDIDNLDIDNQGIDNQDIDNQGIDNQDIDNQGIDNQDINMLEEVRNDYVFVFDTETTGLPDRNKHNATKYYPPEELNHYDSSRIVSIAWMIFNKMGEVKYSRYAVIKPDDFISSPKALAVHGITYQYAMENGTAMKKILKEIEHTLLLCDTMVAFNANFDYHILLSECYRYRCRKTISSIKKMTLKCAQKESIKKIPGLVCRRKKYPKQEEVYRHLFGDPNFSTSHNSFDDTLRCAQIYFKLNGCRSIIDRFF